MIKRLKFPEDYGQLEDGWCGPNLMKQIVLYKKGLHIPEKEFVNMSSCSIKRGTSIKGMIQIAKNFNLNPNAKEDSSIEDIIYSIESDNPVVLLIQAWPFNKVNDWLNTWENGHYVGAFGYNKKQEKIFYYDPCDGKNKSISYNKLEERWHDVDIKIGKKYNNFGIFFKD